ncbi:MAG TPA: MarR family transcriptional regulator [Pelobium sp.]
MSIKLISDIFVVLTIVKAMEKYTAYSLLLDRTSKRVKQYAQKRFKEENFDITVDQWLVLKNLNEHNDQNQSQLAELTGKDHPTLTRILDLMCKKNLVERKPSAEDRRSFIIHLTDLGKAKQKEWVPKVDEIRAKAWEQLNDQDYQDLKRILNTIYHSLS